MTDYKELNLMSLLVAVTIKYEVGVPEIKFGTPTIFL